MHNEMPEKSDSLGESNYGDMSWSKVSTLWKKRFILLMKLSLVRGLRRSDNYSSAFRPWGAKVWGRERRQDQILCEWIRPAIRAHNLLKVWVWRMLDLLLDDGDILTRARLQHSYPALPHRVPPVLARNYPLCPSYPIRLKNRPIS